MVRVAVVLVVVAVAALLVNSWGGIDRRCSDRGWSGCGWTYVLSGWTVVVCVVALVGIGLIVIVRAARRGRA
jgi:hypothetical protein